MPIARHGHPVPRCRGRTPFLLENGLTAPAQLKTRLAAVGQSHLLHFYDRLNDLQRRSLLDQIQLLDLEGLPALVEKYVRTKPAFSPPLDLRPAPYYPFDAASPVRPWDRLSAHATGEFLLKRGAVGAFVVAGGQGSRLGFEGPKGCYPAGSVTGRPLFAIFADQLVAARTRYGRAVPWYIMTSPLNHAPSVAFFKEHSYFGMDPADVMFFPQGVMPSFDIKTGQVLMTGPGEIATNPDGHGGSIRALHLSGALADMKRRGIEHLSYFQVDNPLVRVLDPAFLGLHSAAPDSSGEMSSKMVPKAYPDEKLGVFALINGSLDVIEYSDLPADLATQRTPDGRLRFLAGSIAIHTLGVGFIERLATDPSVALPYHRAEKMVPCIDPQSGAPVVPTVNNGVKLERFVFDALPRCRASIVYETDRTEEFAPIKNATGVDSVESSRAIQTARSARWLERAGVRVPYRPDGTPDCVLEISPLTATCAEELAERPLPTKIDPGARLAL